jgi:8-oxo-dGTP diphosphatase
VSRQWVVGFMFDNDAERVVLIEKNRPEWQAGKLNGVGGKVEPGESISEAMDREFEEETGVATTGWHHFASLQWEEGTVHFFRVFVTASLLDACRTTTDEPVAHYDMHSILAPWFDYTVPNLRWLLPLAAHRHDTYDVIDVVETGTTLRKPGRLDILPGTPLVAASSPSGGTE